MVRRRGSSTATFLSRRARRRTRLLRAPGWGRPPVRVATLHVCFELDHVLIMLTFFVVVKYRDLEWHANDAARRADHAHAALIQLVFQRLAG